MDNRILEEEIIINEVEFLKTTIKPEFVETHELRKVGTDEKYDEAIDIIGSTFIYEAVAKPVAKPVEVEND